jgi:hypothetical protein
MLDGMKLYMGNWVLFHQYLQSSTGAVASVLETGEAETAVEDREHMPFVSDEVTSREEYTEEGYEDDDLVDIDDLEEEGTEITGSTTDFDSDVWDTDFDDDQETAYIEREEKKPAAKKPEPVEDKIEDEETLVDDEEEEEPEEIEEEEEVETPLVDQNAPSNKAKDNKGSFRKQNDEGLIQPLYTEDYFLHQGIPVSDKIPEEVDHTENEKAKSLMVVMSFSEWLVHFKTKGEREKEEHQDQKALKTMWQKEKLAAALEEENEEIPENVFEMAVNSIAKEDDLISESLAEIMVKQEKYDKAVDMYRKLSLRNPQKSAYFARKIDRIQKEKDS